MNDEDANDTRLWKQLPQVAAAISWILIQGKGHQCMVHGFDRIQWYHSIAVVSGVVICLCAVFAITSMLQSITAVMVYLVRVSLQALTSPRFVPD